MFNIKKIDKVIILIIFTLLILTFLTPRVISDTTIKDSTVPVETGDFYKWKMTYCDPDLSIVYGVGSYINITIDLMFDCSWEPIAADALSIDATFGEYAKNIDAYESYFVPPWLVYNATLHYLYISDHISNYFGILIVPIPLNLTMVAEALGEPFYTIDGNVLTINLESGFDLIYKFNSNGFVTNYIRYDEDEKLFEYTLMGKEEIIPFGNYYIFVSILAIICVCLIIKKQNHIIKK